VVKVEPER